MGRWKLPGFFIVTTILAVGSNAQELTVQARPDPKLAIPSHDTVDPGAKPALGDPHYLIGLQDELDINVWKEPDFSRVVTVRPDGKISLALLNDLQAAGLTPMELSLEITERLKEFVSEPHVAVIVVKVNARQIFVVGEVKRAGAYPLVQNMTVLDALSSSGGFTAFAKRTKIRILRKENDQQTTILFNYNQAVHGRGRDQDILLKAGDKILVP
jgi:polysaccharide export outer membrane protein